MYTPITLAQAYTDIEPSDGTDGENQYFHGLYCLGYNNIDLKSVSLGIFKISIDEHNGTSGVVDTDNVNSEVHTYDKILTLNNVRAEYKKTTLRIPISYDRFETVQINSVASIDLWVVQNDPEPPAWFTGERYHYTSLSFIRIEGNYLVFDIGDFGYCHYNDYFYPYEEHTAQYRNFFIESGTISFNVDLRGSFSTMHYPKEDTSSSKGYHQELELQQGEDEVALYPQKVVQENHGTEMMHPEGVDPLYILPFSAKYPQKIQLEVLFQNLVHFNENGSRDSASVDICIGYSLDGGETYLPFTSFQQSSSAVTVSDLGTVTRDDGVFRKVRFSGYKNKAMRFIAEKTFDFEEVFNTDEVTRLKNNIIEFKIFRDSVDYSITDTKYQYKVYFNSIRTWCYDYKKTLEQYLDDGTEELVPQVPIIEKYRDMTARLGFTIRNGQEIQGTLKELNVIMMSRARYCTITEENGEKTYTWSNIDDTVPTNNPASLALMVLQHPMRGEFVYSDEELDMDSFGRFYEWCEQRDQFFINSDGKKYTANGVVSKQFKTIDLVNQILGCGHGKLVIIGNKYGVIYDHEMHEPVMVLNNQNVLSARNTKNFNEDIDGYSCKFIDSLNDYQEDTQIFVPKELTDPESPKYKDPSEYKLESIEVPWVTDAGRAYRMCMYKLACRKLRPEAWEVKMSVDGALVDIGNLVTYQSDTLVVGIGDGAEIVDVKIENGVMVSIVCDYGFNVTDVTKTYGVKIQHSDPTNGVSVINYPLLNFEEEGEHKELFFSRPIAMSDTIKPTIGDIVSFGIYEKESTDAICISKKENNDGTYSLCLIPYQKGIYDDSYESVPEFVSNVTSPIEAGVEVSEETPAPTFEDIGDIASAVVNEGSDEPPVSPVNFTIKPFENYIELKCLQTGSELKDDIKYYEYEITKGSGSQPVVFKSADNHFEYVFDREDEGYPEASDLEQWTFRVRVTNIYNISSTWVSENIDTSDYGTWVIPNLSVTKEIVDRTVILTASYGGSLKKLYGHSNTVARIRRIGNTDTTVESGRTPNQILNITPETDFYVPEFNEPVQTDVNADNEPNYRKHYPEVSTMPLEPEEGDIVRYIGTTNVNYTNGKYYEYNGSGWKETDVDYKTSSNKITHTVPLIGQTYRIFKTGDVFTGTYTKDVPDVDFVPVSPEEGDVIHWITDSRTTAPKFIENGYYLYENSEWILVQNKSLIVPTFYEYEIFMTNESGYQTSSVIVSAKAECTNIADIVHSHEHYKNVYVEKLSAICANIGLIQEGGMGSFKDALNYWALSNLSPEDSGTLNGVKKGAFRVGGRDQYFLVEPDENDPEKFKIELRAGSINLTTESDKEGFVNGTYIYDGDPNFATQRLALLATGIVAQQYNPQTTKWDNVSRFILDGKGNLIISNADESELFAFGFNIPENQGTIYHFDTVAEQDEQGTNPYDISCSGQIVSTERKSPILLPESSPNCFEGTVETDISRFVGTAVFFTKASGIEVDRQINIDGSIKETYKTYNSAMSETKGAGTVGSYLGLSASQISDGIFEQIGE